MKNRIKTMMPYGITELESVRQLKSYSAAFTGHQFLAINACKKKEIENFCRATPNYFSAIIKQHTNLS
jgi:hypothetical protein